MYFNLIYSDIPHAISMCKAYWAWEAASPDKRRGEPPGEPAAQKNTVISAAKRGELTDKHILMLLETPLESSSGVPALLESIVENSKSHSVGITDCISRFCRSTDRDVRLNASFSMLSICEKFPPLLRMFRLQSLISMNLTETQYGSIVKAAANSLVELCKKKTEGVEGGAVDGLLVSQTLSFFREQSLVFSDQIDALLKLPPAPSRSPINKRGLHSKVGVPSNYPKVSRRPSLLGMEDNRKKLSTIRPVLPKAWMGPRIPRERY